MKNFIKLPLFAILIFFFTAATPAHKPAPIKSSVTTKSLVTVYVANGTAWTGTLTISGGLSGGFGTSGAYYMGSINTGFYGSVTISYTGPKVSHQFNLTGYPTQINSNGTATWTGVNITGPTTVSIY